MNLIHRIRCAIDESYRIKVGFGLSPIRNDRELKALIDFCRNTSAEYRMYGFTDSSNLKVWDKTVKLYDKWEQVGLGYEELTDYIHQHVDEYWS